MRFRYSERKLVELFANSGYTNQTPQNAASDLGLHCLPIPLQGSPDYNGLIPFADMRVQVVLKFGTLHFRMIHAVDWYPTLLRLAGYRKGTYYII